MADIDKEEVIALIGAWAESEHDVRKAFLFGSVARGDNTPDSDIDVAIQLNARPGIEVELAVWSFERDRLSESLQGLLPGPLQLEWYDPVETPTVHKGIVESSILVYDQGSQVGA